MGLPIMENGPGNQERWVTFAQAEGDFAPGDHHRFAVKMSAPKSGTYAIVVTLQGDPRANTRGEVWINFSKTDETT